MTIETQPIIQQTNATPRQETALATGRTMTPGQLATVLIEQQNFDVDKLARLMELQERHETKEEKKAYAQAIVNFRAKCPTIIRTGSASYGQGKASYTYAQLPQVIEQIQALMDDCGLAATWSTLEQTAIWIKVRCTITHILNHSEFTELGGPPDTSGSKNQLQAIKSTWTYLRRVTLFSLLGLVDKDEVDDDGAGGSNPEGAKPQSRVAIEDDENDIKRQFMATCRKKAGSPNMSSAAVKLAFAAAQTACGSMKATECLLFVQQNVVTVGANGSIAVATFPPTDDSETTPIIEADLSIQEQPSIWRCTRNHDHVFDHVPLAGKCEKCLAAVEEIKD